ncbi:MAG: DUF6431 domain-containing protein [Clostridia bacterium]
MKLVLTEGRTILGELIRELAVTTDEALIHVLAMAVGLLKMTAPTAIGARLEQLAADLIVLIPADKPVLPGGRYARLSALITSLQIAARKDQWAQSVDRVTGEAKHFPCTDDVYTGHCPVCGAPLLRFGHRDRSLVNESGEREIYDLRRLRCKHCHRTHIELLDCMVPYHRHSASVIEAALDGKANQLAGSQISEWNIARLRRRFADMGSALIEEAMGRVKARLAATKAACGGERGWVAVLVCRLLADALWQTPANFADGAGDPLRKK